MGLEVYTPEEAERALNARVNDRIAELIGRIRSEMEAGSNALGVMQGEIDHRACELLVLELRRLGWHARMRPTSFIACVKPFAWVLEWSREAFLQPHENVVREAVRVSTRRWWWPWG